jgi:hypothetical protein
MVRRPGPDPARYTRVWDEVFALRDAYTMSP